MGVGITRRTARLVLGAGLCGPGLRTRGAVLYGAERVRAVADRPEVAHSSILRVQWPGTLVVRLGAASGLDLLAGVEDGEEEEEQRASVSGPWGLSPWLRARIGLALSGAQFSEPRPVPFVATVGGFVALGADIVGAAPEDSRPRAGVLLDLAPPSDWYDGFGRRRLPTGRGGPWRFYSSPPLPRAQASQPLQE